MGPKVATKVLCECREATREASHTHGNPAMLLIWIGISEMMRRQTFALKELQLWFFDHEHCLKVMRERSLTVSDRAIRHMTDLNTSLWLVAFHAYGNILSVGLARTEHVGLVNPDTNSGRMFPKFPVRICSHTKQQADMQMSANTAISI